MTIESRLDVSTALQEADWTTTPGPFGDILKHPSGVTWEIATEAGGCCLNMSDGVSVDFRSTVPNPVVIAAALAATAQLDPSQDRVDLEESAAWLNCLEAAGLDNWDGVDTARDIRRERTS